MILAALLSTAFAGDISFTLANGVTAETTWSDWTKLATSPVLSGKTLSIWCKAGKGCELRDGAGAKTPVKGVITSPRDPQSIMSPRDMASGVRFSVPDRSAFTSALGATDVLVVVVPVAKASETTLHVLVNNEN